MSAHFQEILNIPEVIGVLVFTNEGDRIFETFRDRSLPIPSDPSQWKPILDSFKELGEADLLYDNNRIYFKKTDGYQLIVVMDLHAPLAMVRMNCDMALSASSTHSTMAQKAGRWIKRKFI